MSVQTRTRDILLPILLFPVVIPVLLAAVKASSGFLTGADTGRCHAADQFTDRLRYYFHRRCIHGV
jgi:ABC-type transport system involved in cytochrome c biogenesis permease component